MKTLHRRKGITLFSLWWDHPVDWPQVIWSADRLIVWSLLLLPLPPREPHPPNTTAHSHEVVLLQGARKQVEYFKYLIGLLGYIRNLKNLQAHFIKESQKEIKVDFNLIPTQYLYYRASRYDVRIRRGRGLWKSGRIKGGCMNFIL